MSEQTGTEVTDTDTLESEPQTDGQPEGPKGLREAAARAKEHEQRAAAAEAEVQTLKRQLAFQEAGVPTEGAGKWFRQGYDGDLSVDAIKAAAIEDGIIDTASPAPSTDEVSADLAAADRMAGATQAAAPPVARTSADEVREVGKDGFGDYGQLQQMLANTSFTDSDFDRYEGRDPFSE